MSFSTLKAFINKFLPGLDRYWVTECLVVVSKKQCTLSFDIMLHWTAVLLIDETLSLSKPLKAVPFGEMSTINYTCA